MEIHHLTKSRTIRAAIGAFAIFLLPRSLCLASVSDGYVVKVESATVYLDWGKTSGVQAGDQFKIYRSGEPLKHPVTGEILGTTETSLGQGVVNGVEEKFSTARLIDTKAAVKPGDRTRYTEKAEAPAQSPPQEALAAPTGAPKELWRSEPISGEATGLALGDVDGDGKKEVVVAFRNYLEVFRWNGQKLESAGRFKSRGYSNFLTVDTGDIEGAGRDKIFAGLFIEGVKRSRTVALAFSSGTFQEAGRMDGFVRSFDHAGKREVLWQDMTLARELRIKQPAPLTKTPKGFREGNPLALPKGFSSDQLFGYAWGDWDDDGSEDFAYLQNGERLRILFKDAKWGSTESYGGTKSDFNWENEQVGSLYPRLLNWKTAAGKSQLLVPHNIPFTPIRLARLKIFKNSEIIDMSWNGQEMKPVWTLPLSGSLADLAMGDALQNGAPQLWVATVGSGDKTVLLAYQVP